MVAIAGVRRVKVTAMVMDISLLWPRFAPIVVMVGVSRGGLAGRR